MEEIKIRKTKKKRNCGENQEKPRKSEILKWQEENKKYQEKASSSRRRKSATGGSRKKVKGRLLQSYFKKSEQMARCAREDQIGPVTSTTIKM